MNYSFPDFQLFVPSDAKNHTKLALPETSTSLLIVSDQKLEDHQEMLSKMISAINLHFKDEVHFIYLTTDQSMSLAKYCREAEISTVLIFGLAPKALSLHLEPTPYHFFEIAGLKILFGHTLNDIAANRDYKVRLWNALKEMFPQ